jgi:hypothetical protein
MFRENPRRISAPALPEQIAFRFCAFDLSLFSFSALESDPFHQNDELDKIPTLP